MVDVFEDMNRFYRIYQKLFSYIEMVLFTLLLNRDGTTKEAIVFKPHNQSKVTISINELALIITVHFSKSRTDNCYNYYKVLMSRFKLRIDGD